MKLLCLCDSLTLTSGFSRVATNLIRRWAKAGAEIDVWGIAFQGWGYKEHPYVKTFFPAGTGQQGDHWASAEHLSLFLAQLQVGGYTHVWILQDTFQLVNFNFPAALRRICTEKAIKSMLYFPVDAPLDPEWTDIIAAVDVAVAFTKYGADEAGIKLALRLAELYEQSGKRKAESGNQDGDSEIVNRQSEILNGLNYDIKIQVLPHGVDTDVYKPLPGRAELRRTFWQTEFAGPDDFLMLNVNVNQRRKDVGRSLEVLKAVRELGVPAKLLMHMSCISDDGLHLEKIGRQLGLECNVHWSHHDHLFVRGQGKFKEADMNQLYNIADLYLTTSLGEGWGLGITEALAAGVSVAVPDHTSCREIADGLAQGGMATKRVVLPVEENFVMQGLDNSRCRKRVDVVAAAYAIKSYYDAGSWRYADWRKLTPEVEEWLCWDRIAREMRKLFGKADSGKRKAETTL